MANEVYGSAQPENHFNDLAAMQFLFRQMALKMQTATLVKVIAVTNSGGLEPVGFVDVQPLVNQMTGDRKPVEHGVIHKIPYFRIQGGGDAVIIDPKIGDIGMCAFASRDISGVKAKKGIANPGSHRVFDWADGMYFGGFLNGVPEQYLMFSGGGIKAYSPTKIIIESPSVEINAKSQCDINSPVINLNGALTQGAGGNAGEASFANKVNIPAGAKINDIEFIDHVHDDADGGDTGTPK